jgi:hypothetical protein
MIRFTILIEKHTQEIIKINLQRRRWLVASSVVFVCVVLLIFGWDWLTGLHEKSIWWVIVSLMLIVCMNWWYWTMKVIYHLLEHQSNEYAIIADLLNDIKALKKQLSELSIDND